MAPSTPKASSRRARSAPRSGAFFDMDKTLISDNSWSLYMRYLYDRGEIGESALARGLADYLRYKVGALDLDSWVEDMAAPLAGRKEADLAQEARAWFFERVKPKVYPEAARRVAHPLERGDVVAIVSGATRFVVDPLAELLGIEHVVCTQLEVEKGSLTGRIIGPACFEEGKVHWLSEFNAKHRVDLSKSWFYTDSITDLPLLERVGHPVVTNPDLFLYWTARRRQWPVMLFEPAAATSGEAR